MTTENKVKIQKWVTWIAMGVSLTAAPAAHAQTAPSPLPHKSQVVAHVAYAAQVASTVATPVLTARALGSPLFDLEPKEQVLLGVSGTPRSMGQIRSAAGKFQNGDNMVIYRRVDGITSGVSIGTQSNRAEEIAKSVVKYSQKEIGAGNQIVGLSRFKSVDKIRSRSELLAWTGVATFVSSLLVQGFEYFSNDALSGLLPKSPKISDLQTKALQGKIAAADGHASSESAALSNSQE